MQLIHILIIILYESNSILKDGQPISGGDYEEKSNGNERTLLVKNCKDSGEYSIECGTAKMSAKLKVNGASEPSAPEPAAAPTPQPKTEEPKPQVR